MKIFTCVLLLATMATVASGSAMMESFERYRNEKANKNRLPSSAKGVICEKSGRKPKDTCCYNKHGVRCSRDFQRETGTCPGAVCPRRRVDWCDKNYEGTYDYDGDDRYIEKKRLKSGARCDYERNDDGDDNYMVFERCITNGDVQESLCAQPCGCVLDGQPKRESSGTMKTQMIRGECGSNTVVNQMKKILSSWKVPKETLSKYEMAALFDQAQFAIFDLFIQPKRNEARYKLAMGAARCHQSHVEIGYMDTGMWTVDTLNDYKCHHKGGCSKVGIPPESIDKARVVLEHYAWKNLRVSSGSSGSSGGSRPSGRKRCRRGYKLRRGRCVRKRGRLLEDGDSMDDLFVHTVRIPESTEMAQEEEWANADMRTLEERVAEDNVRQEMAQEEEWANADMRTLEERVADAEEDKLGFGMPTDGNVEDWVTFRP